MSGRRQAACLVEYFLRSFLLLCCCDFGRPSTKAVTSVLPFMPRRWCGRQLIVALYVGVENGLRLAPMVSNQVRRPSTRKCWSKRARCRRSTMPLDCRRLTLVA